MLEETLEETLDTTPGPEAAAPALDKKRLEDQLSALKRKELELRRAIAIADHPALADAIRSLEGRAYALARAEAKVAQGLSKAEAKRKETLERKLEGLREKSAELNAQIAVLDAERATLVDVRAEALAAERQAALQGLVLALGEHAAALATAGLVAADLVPEIALRMPEIRALAEKLASARVS